MPKNKSVQTLLLSVVAIMVICLLAAAISLTTQKPINKIAQERPVSGVQVTVINGSAPNAKPISVTTDSEGKFSFDPLPAGTYSMTLRFPDAGAKVGTSKMEVDRTTKAGELQSSDLSAAKITIEGTTEGTLSRGWDVKAKKPIALSNLSKVEGTEKQKADLSQRSTQPGARTETDLVFTTDGKQKIKGAVHDISMNSIRNMKG